MATACQRLGGRGRPACLNRRAVAAIVAVVAVSRILRDALEARLAAPGAAS